MSASGEYVAHVTPPTTGTPDLAPAFLLCEAGVSSCTEDHIGDCRWCGPTSCMVPLSEAVDWFLDHPDDDFASDEGTIPPWLLTRQ